MTFKADSITDEIEDNVKDDDLELNKEVLGVSLGSHSIYPLYIYIYIHIHIYICIYILVQIYGFFAFLYMYVCIYIYMHPLIQTSLGASWFSSRPAISGIQCLCSNASLCSWASLG